MSETALYNTLKNWLHRHPLQAFAVTNIAGDMLIVASGMINGELRDIPALLGIAGNSYALLRSRETEIAPAFNEKITWRGIATDCSAAISGVTMSLLRTPSALTRDLIPALKETTAHQAFLQFKKAADIRSGDHVKETLFALVGICGALYAVSGLTSEPPRWLETFAGLSLVAGAGMTWLGQNARLGSQFFMAGTGAMLYSSLEPGVRTGIASGSVGEGLAALDPFVLGACCIFAVANHMMGRIRMRAAPGLPAESLAP